MQNPSFKEFPFSLSPPSQRSEVGENTTAAGQAQTSGSGTGAGSSMAVDDLARIFNTALVATKSQQNRDFQSELYQLMESPAFRAILTAIRQHARMQGLSEKHAAEQVIRTFRKLDELWSSYVFQEGVDRLGSGV
jgi:hypothetical protein